MINIFINWSIANNQATTIIKMLSLSHFSLVIVFFRRSRQVVMREIQWYFCIFWPMDEEFDWS